MESISTGISIPDQYLLSNAKAIQEAIERSITIKVGETLDSIAWKIRSALDTPPALQQEHVFGDNKVYRSNICSSLDELKNLIDQQLITIARIKHLQYVDTHFPMEVSCSK